MKYLMLLLGCWLDLTALAQYEKESGLNRIRLNGTEQNVEFEIRNPETLPSADAQKTYYWYSAGEIKKTRGGFSGRLLNGTYTAFYSNKTLKEQGSFNLGLKDGVWKSWTNEGQLINWVTWKNGIENGAYSYYGANGALSENGRYKKGIRDGLIHYYPAKDSVTVVFYKNGQAIKQKKGLWQRLNFFGNHEHNTDSASTRTLLRQP